MFRFIAPERGTDAAGDGGYGASRGGRSHRGVDYAVLPGSVLLSPVNGRITKIGYPYADDLSYRYVQITTKRGEHHRFFYVEPHPDLEENQKIRAEQTPIGVTQDVTARYPELDMTPHIHYEIKDASGAYLNPEKYWEGDHPTG